MVAAKGKANIGGITVGSKNVKIVLEVSKRDFFKNAKFFESDPEEVDFVLGDMQMSISDYLESSASSKELLASVGNSDVKQSVKDEDQVVLFDQQHQQQGSQEAQAAPNPDLEVSFEDGNIPAEGGHAADGGGHAEGKDEAEGTDESGSEPSKEEVEEHILKEQPRFDDVEFDPSLYIEKVETQSSWMDIASKYGLSSNQLQKAWGKYKNRVAEKLKQKGAA
ncbi:hypothetical protein PM3016_1451 [Paenibacillus mucilaginosus 3016]|uniref:Uncharacterized protein n=1 Tax=Paenibacillus mucilaginosus 3016 TaxID=1116391 RepID=H6NGT4_9BACL|nr:hypothetical protein [Paenibacillus mucilaginosus]AFC28376.1 hypothetical protein PM3016_1451 [Paenibacillus mucilaginosus 3016]WFA17177.1 hypothetical protein ERY13_07635 [Paenibacillus mucilaginosus]